MINTKKLHNIHWDEINRLHKDTKRFAKSKNSRILFEARDIDPALKARANNQASALAGEEGFWASQCKLYCNQDVKFKFTAVLAIYYVVCLGAEVGNQKAVQWLNEIYRCHDMVKTYINADENYNPLEEFATDEELVDANEMQDR